MESPCSILVELRSIRSTSSPWSSTRGLTGVLREPEWEQCQTERVRTGSECAVWAKYTRGLSRAPRFDAARLQRDPSESYQVVWWCWWRCGDVVMVSDGDDRMIVWMQICDVCKNSPRYVAKIVPAIFIHFPLIFHWFSLILCKFATFAKIVPAMLQK